MVKGNQVLLNIYRVIFLVSTVDLFNFLRE